MLELKLNYRNKIYRKRLEEEKDNPLYAAAVADTVLERLERVERENPNIVDTQEIAIIAGLVAEHEYSNQKDLYIRTITEAHKKISDARLLLNSAMDSLKEKDNNDVVLRQLKEEERKVVEEEEPAVTQKQRDTKRITRNGDVLISS